MPRIENAGETGEKNKVVAIEKGVTVCRNTDI